MTLEDIYLHRLADLHETEEQLIQSLLETSRVSTSPDLREVLQVKLQQTSACRERLEAMLEGTRLDQDRAARVQRGEHRVVEEWDRAELSGNGRARQDLWDLTLESFLQSYGGKSGGQSAA